MQRLASLALLLMIILAPVQVARAQDDALAALATTNFQDTARAVERLAASGNAAALPVLEALRAQTLFFRADDRALFIRDGQGFRTPDGASADVAAGALRQVRLNNQVRRAVDAAIGTLSLLNPDPRLRLAAATAVLRARDAEALPALDVALARETDSRIRRVMEAARAVIVLATPGDEAAKLAAVAILRARGDLDSRTVLAGLSGQSEAVARAAADAVVSMDRRLAFWKVMQDLYSGVSLGSVLLLAAIGLAVTFGVMGVINMAHGEMVMLGAYTVYVVQEFCRTRAPHLLDYSLAVAIPLAFLVAALVGALIERTVIRFLYGRPLETLLATFGLSLVLQQAVRTIFGPNNREVSNPSFMSGAVMLDGLQVTLNRAWIIGFAIFVFVGLLLVLRRTRLGLAMRAVTQNRRMAASMGIRTPWVDCLTFALGSGVAGLAGVALSQIDNVSPNLGQGYIIDSFMVVVFGGVGNLWGTLVAALTLGITNKLLEPFAGAVLGKIIVLVALILFIQSKPRGLFPLKGRAVET
jgi:urea transport system permease protein